jgi:hypothetical protein
MFFKGCAAVCAAVDIARHNAAASDALSKAVVQTTGYQSPAE